MITGWPAPGRRETAASAAGATSQAPSMVAAKNHPDYSKYFRMRRMGVPLGAVLQKMGVDGVDEAIVNTPDVLMPLAPVTAG
ncbi:unnamed protein product, partial [Hapterophycus canaliculatus]